MKRNDIAALHSKSVEELQAQLLKVQTELAESKLALKVGKLTNTAKVRMLRDDVARIKTIVREKQVRDAAAQAVAQTSTKS